MTNADKIRVFGALLLMALLAVEGHHVRGNSAVLTFGLPLAMYGMDSWVRRARTDHWLEKNDQNEVISRRPVSQRVLFGFMAGFCAWITYKTTLSLLPLFSDPAAWGAIVCLLLMLGSLVSCFLLGTGSRRICLDLRHQHYSLQQGIPLLMWTKQGKTTGGELSISQSKSGCYRISFRASNWRFALPIESFNTDEEARFQAWEIANKLKVRVKRRSVS